MGKAKNCLSLKMSLLLAAQIVVKAMLRQKHSTKLSVSNFTVKTLLRNAQSPLQILSKITGYQIGTG